MANDAYETLKAATKKHFAILLEVMKDDRELAQKFVEMCFEETVADRKTAASLVNLLRRTPGIKLPPK